jgi:type VI secretion system secreted protein Hcp
MGALLGAMGMSGVASAAPVAELVSAASGPVDYFLKIDGIEGESTDAKHKGEIQLLSFSWGASNATPVATARARAGRTTVSAFSFQAVTSKASPKLFMDCATGKHHPSAVVTARRAGEVGLEFIKLTLSDVLVSSYQTSGAEGSLPVDSASLSFARISYSYTPQNADGSAGAAVAGSWDLRSNRA